MFVRAGSRRRAPRGVAMVEGAVGLIILLFVVFGIIEYGQFIMARQLMNSAARSAARVASAGNQPATYPDGTASPSPGGGVTTAYLNTWIAKALLPAPVSNANPQYYGSNADGSPNTSLAWNSTTFGRGFYVDLKATYIPLFSGNRLYADKSGYTGPMVGSAAMRSLVYALAEANN